MVHPDRSLSWTQVAQSSPDAELVQSRKPKAQNPPLPAAVVQQFAGDDFTFTIGVGGDDHLISLSEQFLNDLKLILRVLFNDNLPP